MFHLLLFKIVKPPLFKILVQLKFEFSFKYEILYNEIFPAVQYIMNHSIITLFTAQNKLSTGIFFSLYDENVNGIQQQYCMLSTTLLK